MVRILHTIGDDSKYFQTHADTGHRPSGGQRFNHIRSYALAFESGIAGVSALSDPPEEVLIGGIQHLQGCFAVVSTSRSHSSSFFSTVKALSC